MSEEQEFSEIELKIEQLKRLDMNDYAREKELGSTYTFAPIIPELVKVQDFFLKIPLSKIEDLPNAHTHLIVKNVDNFIQWLSRIKTFNAGSNNAIRERNAIIENINRLYQGIFGELYPIVNYLKVENLNVTEIETEAQRVLKETEKRNAALIREISDQSEKADQIVQSIQQTAAKAGVSKEAEHFLIASNEHKTIAKRWLIASVCLSVLVLLTGGLYIWLGYSQSGKGANLSDAMQLIFAKGVVIGIEVTLVLACIKNYMASRHNQVVNKHRYNALLTYKAFAEATDNIDKKDTILSHAAVCIYGARDTGFSKGANQNAMPATGLMGVPVFQNIASQATE